MLCISAVLQATMLGSMSRMSQIRVNQYEVYFLGMIQDVNLGATQQRDPDVQLIDRVEEGQVATNHF